MAGLLSKEKPKQKTLLGGNLPMGLLSSGNLSSYTPTLREKIISAMARNWYGDSREGYQQAGNLMKVADMTPVGIATGMYDAGRAAGQGNYAEAGINSLAVVPFAAALKTPVKRAALEANETLMRAVANTKGSRLADEGLALNVSRNQNPAQAGEPSVRGGVFYLPQGSKDQKYYTGTRENFAYGGTERIAGETLVKNPLVAKGATGGKAPEAAFDSLNGKGAYQKMRTDALQMMPGYGIKDSGLREEAISRFLEKYAPELVGQEWHILANTTKGNQLAYALQEAAVASAVRRAGHDAVLGYGVSRKTKEPFISEIFDVRESHYPDKDGGFSMWPEFEGGQ